MRKERLQNVRADTSMGPKNFAPFQKFSQFHSILEIDVGGYRYAVIVLYDKAKNEWSAQIPFRFTGYHDQLDRDAIVSATEALTEGLGRLPDGEFLTFSCSSRSNPRRRQRELAASAEQCDVPALSVLTLNESARVEEVTRSGARQEWDQLIWATWTSFRASEAGADGIGKALVWVRDRYQEWLRQFVGTKQAHFNAEYVRLAREMHESGFLRWLYRLDTQCQLQVSPLSARELWEELWYQFNTRPAPELPHHIRVTESETGVNQDVPPSGRKDLMTLLIEGDRGRTSCPKHHRQHGYVFVKGRVGKPVVVESPPEMWRNKRDLLRSVWELMSAPFMADVDCTVQLSSRPVGAAKHELTKMAKQSHTDGRRAAAEGTGRHVQADMQSRESTDALYKLEAGRVPLRVACVFVIWRDTLDAVDEAAQQFVNSFGTAQVVTEDDIAWRVWLETLPLNNDPLLAQYSSFSERRLTLDSETAPGMLPLTVPRDLDERGIEFVTDRGGKPVFVDCCNPQTGRVLVTGTSGSGKSVLGWRFMQEALVQGMPVVGLDLSTGGSSTFGTAIEMMGDDAAYLDIMSRHLNIMEPPDLQTVSDPAESKVRLHRWMDMLKSALAAIAMGQVDDPALRQRVESTLNRLLKVFFGDPTICERYNEAFAAGWRSEAWQRMPTLYDLLGFCSPQKLGLDDVGDLDRAAINQIHSEVGAKLDDPNIGGVLGKPSNVSPNSRITFFALSGLSSDQNAYIMALVAHMAAMRQALASNRSLFVGDELSALFNKKGFAEIVGELLAVGRKTGICTLLLSQDLDAIAHCSASAQIMANLTTTITGLVTHAQTPIYREHLGLDGDTIARNASEGYRANKTEMYSRWLLARNGNTWDCRYYIAPMALAALANGEVESAARDRVMQKHPNTTAGYLRGLQEFSQQYTRACRGGCQLEDIGREVAPTGSSFATVK